MKYIIYLKIRNFPKYYVEVGTYLDLLIHPTLTDEITVDGYDCKIERISYNLKENEGIIWLISEDVPDEDEECKVAQRLKYEAKELMELGWWLDEHDYGER